MPSQRVLVDRDIAVDNMVVNEGRGEVLAVTTSQLCVYM